MSADIPFKQKPPLSNAEAVELLNLIRELGDQRDEDAESILPTIPSLVDPKALDQIVLKERELTVRLQSVPAEALSVLNVLTRISPQKRRCLQTALCDYVSSFDALALETEGWTARALHDVAAGRHHSWRT